MVSLRTVVAMLAVGFAVGLAASALHRGAKVALLSGLLVAIAVTWLGAG